MVKETAALPACQRSGGANPLVQRSGEAVGQVIDDNYLSQGGALSARRLVPCLSSSATRKHSACGPRERHGDRLMIVRSRTVILALSALLGAVIAAPGAWAANITRGGQPAELTVTSGGAHSVRVTLKPVGRALPPSPSLLTLVAWVAKTLDHRKDNPGGWRGC